MFHILLMPVCGLRSGAIFLLERKDVMFVRRGVQLLPSREPTPFFPS
jgi:integrase